MIYFLFFFLGVFTVTLIMPVLSALEILIEQKLELEKAKLALKVRKINQELGDDQEEISTSVIGFNIDDKEPDEEDED